LHPRYNLERHEKIIFWLLGLAFLALAFSFFSFVYWSQAIEGRVVDKDSGMPIPNSIVVATWRLRGNWGRSAGYIAVSETLTNDQGYFKVPAWGPRLNLSLDAHLRGSEPILRIFKSGYIPIVVDNLPPRSMGPGQAKKYIRFRLNGTEFEMIEFNGSLVEYNFHLQKLYRSLNLLILERACEMKTTAPFIVRELGKYGTEMVKNDIRSTLTYIESKRFYERCIDQ